MKAELSRLILFVDDIEKMSDFYSVVLGLEKLPGGSDGFVLRQVHRKFACIVCRRSTNLKATIIRNAKIRTLSSFFIHQMWRRTGNISSIAACG